MIVSTRSLMIVSHSCQGIIRPERNIERFGFYADLRRMFFSVGGHAKMGIQKWIYGG